MRARFDTRFEALSGQAGLHLLFRQGKSEKQCLSPLSCNSPVLLTGGKVPSSSTSKAASQSPGWRWVVCDSFFVLFALGTKAFYLTSLAIWLDPSIWWKLVLQTALFAGNIGNKGNTSLTNNMTISVRLYCIHFRKDIGKSIHLYSVHVAGVQQLDALNLIKIVFNKDPRLHNATRSIQSIFQDGSADPEPKHLGDLLTTDDARTVLDVETSSNMVWIHRSGTQDLSPRERWFWWAPAMDWKWLAGQCLIDLIEIHIFEMQATVDIDFGVSCICWTQKAWDCKYVTFFCRKKLIEQCTFEPRMFVF